MGCLSKLFYIYWRVMINFSKKTVYSWGRIKASECGIVYPRDGNKFSLQEVTEQGSVLPFGLGRSYGDSCLNSEGLLIQTTGLNKFLSFDREVGILSCEAGGSLDEILKVIVPSGWFLPTTPGTKFITLGGAVANDVHGKNHHVAGSFGNNVLSLDLMKSSGEVIRCSPDENTSLFYATIGGLGLTGLIIQVTIQLKKVAASQLEVESIPFQNLEEFFKLSQENDNRFEHTVSWIDCLASGDSMGRGIYMGGNFSSNGEKEVHKASKLFIPIEAPEVLLSPFNIKAFNTFYYSLQKSMARRKEMHYEPFFYPLDKINSWNKLYGKRGFYQYQSVIPHENALDATKEMLNEISSAKQGSFLAVLKTFGDIESVGMLSFCRPGVTLALDFPNTGKSLHKLFAKLDKIVRDAGGSLYPAKDARMTSKDFRISSPRLDEFKAFIDPKFTSDFWNRVQDN